MISLELDYVFQIVNGHFMSRKAQLLSRGVSLLRQITLIDPKTRAKMLKEEAGRPCMRRYWPMA